LAGIIPTFRQRKRSFFQELAHLAFAAADACQGFDFTLRVFDAGRGMSAEMGLYTQSGDKVRFQPFEKAQFMTF